MKRILAIFSAILIILALSGCLKKSDIPCSRCQSEKAYLYEIERIGKQVLPEKTTISYCKKCYDIYLEETFGYGLKAKAEEDYARFKDIVGSGGYIEDLK